jgi:hypothetical protein
MNDRPPRSIEERRLRHESVLLHLAPQRRSAAPRRVTTTRAVQPSSCPVTALMRLAKEGAMCYLERSFPYSTDRRQ